MEREVTISITVPVECTEDQFQEWIYYVTGYTANLSLDNPLYGYELDANSVSTD